MKITNIDYKPIISTKDDPSLFVYLTTLGFSAPIQLPRMVRLFGKDVEFISIGKYGQILCGGWHKELKEIPVHWEDFLGADILLPFGQPVSLFACGNSVRLYERDGAIVIDFNIKDYDRKVRQIFQVQFPLDKPNVVEYHYYMVHTEYNVMVGAYANKDDYVEWPGIKENWVYSKAALSIDTTAPNPQAPQAPQPQEEELKEGYEWKTFNTPMGQVRKQVKVTGNWVTAFESERVKVLIRN